MKFIVLMTLWSLSAFAASYSPVEEAVQAAQIKQDDSLEVKIDKALRLLNEERYFNPKTSPTPQSNSKGNPYELDSMRTPDQILSQKVGGSCGSSALAFAAILKSSGVNTDNIRIVAAVVNRDLAEICPKAGVPRVPSPRNGASGHVFVAVQFPDQKWLLIDSIDGSRNYERAPWFAPEEVQRLMKTGLQVPPSAYKKLPPKSYSSGLTVFQSWKLEEVPIHTFEQRFDLIAAGEITKSLGVCRFTAPK